MKKILLLIFLLIPTLFYGQVRKEKKERKDENEFVLKQIIDVFDNYEDLLKSANESIDKLKNQEVQLEIDTLKQTITDLETKKEKLESANVDLQSKIDDVNLELNALEDNKKILSNRLTDCYTIILDNWETSFDAIGEYENQYPDILVKLLNSTDLNNSQYEELQEILRQLDILISIKESLSNPNLYFNNGGNLASNYIKQLKSITSDQLMQIKSMLLNLFENDVFVIARTEFSNYITSELRSKPTKDEGKIDPVSVALLYSPTVTDIMQLLLNSPTDIYYLTWLFESYDNSIKKHRNLLETAN